MANTLGVYNPIFYAQEALIWLRNSLGMAARIHRGYEAERRAFGLGDTINIRRPSTFTVANAPDTTGQDLSTETVTITLNQWKEVKFKLTDKELAYTGQRIIDEHIAPAAYALANNIDQAVLALYTKVPHIVINTGAVGVSDITAVRKKQFDAQVPLDNQDAMHFMLDSQSEADLLSDAAFAQWQGAGAAGVDTQLRGTLGRRYGYEFFATQNSPTHTTSTATDAAGALATTGASKGDTTLSVVGLQASATYKAGDVIVMTTTGNAYAITADTAMSGAGAHAAVPISPAVREDEASSAAFTLVLESGPTSMAFHRDAFALAMVPLSNIGANIGANVFTASDDQSGLSVRARIYYVGNSSEVHVALDVLYGVQILNPDLACRMVT